MQRDAMDANGAKSEAQRDEPRHRLREGEDVGLVVSDDGPGSIEPGASRTHLGFSIISNLAGALGGAFTHESRGGFIARLRFPLDSAPEPSWAR